MQNCGASGKQEALNQGTVLPSGRPWVHTFLLALSQTTWPCIHNGTLPAGNTSKASCWHGPTRYLVGKHRRRCTHACQ